MKRTSKQTLRAIQHELLQMMKKYDLTVMVCVMADIQETGDFEAFTSTLNRQDVASRRVSDFIEKCVRIGLEVGDDVMGEDSGYSGGTSRIDADLN